MAIQKSTSVSGPAGVRVDFSRAELIKFNKDIKRYISEFGEKKANTMLVRLVRKHPYKEARAILVAKAGGRGALESKGLIIAKEKNSGATASYLMGGGRAKKNVHGFLAHWVELGTSGIVRDGGKRYKSGQRYRAEKKGIHFLRDSAKNTSVVMFKDMNKRIDRAFKRLGK